MANKDYYRILGVDKKASQADVKKAYRRLARRYHPDINPGDKSSEERFKSIQEAYGVLSNPEKRQIYDRFGEVGQAPGGGFQDFGEFRGFNANEFGGGFSSFGDIFADLFGSRRSRRSARPEPHRGQDLEYHISIPFLDAVSGTQTQINFTRSAACSRCGGSGSTSSTKMRTCPSCGGEGRVEQHHGTMRFVTNCPRCGGRGRIRLGDCGNCAGTGTVQTAENLTVRIPAGVNTGSRVRVPRKGNAGEFGGPSGDLYLIVEVKPHPLFTRNGKDILCRIPVTVTEAALGSKIEVPTVHGKAWLSIPPGTQSGQKFRLRGRGAPALRGGGRGDQIVEVSVVLPRIEDQRSKELLKEFAQLNPHNPRRDLGLR